MLKQKPAAKILPCAALAVLCGLTMTASALAQGAATPSAGAAKPSAAAPGDMQTSLAGTWQCKPNPDPCTWPGASPAVTQSGNDLQIKGADGAIADAKMTSATTISAGGTFNSFGIVRPDKSIDWSDGTKWNKQ
jgi:hypothetical protein